MKTRVSILIILTLFVAPQLYAAAGGSSGGGIAQPQTKRLTPEERAVASYDAGLKHRDRAARYEQKAVGEDNERKLAKLNRKIDKQYNKAIDDFEKAINYHPGIFEAHSSLGFALRKIGRFDASLLAYNESLRLNPSYGQAIEYRGETYLGLNRPTEAKQAYMDLFQSDRALADELMAAMIEWVAMRHADGAGMDASVIQEFAEWVDQRNTLASFVYPRGDFVRNRWAPTG